MLKHCMFLSAAIIHVDITPTEPSTLGLSLGAPTHAGMTTVL
jgi:hypothetical protein